MNNLLKEKISKNIIDLIGNELDSLTKITNDELLEKHRVENQKYLEIENNKLRLKDDEYKSKMKIISEKEELLEKQLRDTREHMDAKEKVSIYQRYENTINTKNGEIKILQFKIKSLEEQLKKYKVKESNNVSLQKNKELKHMEDTEGQAEAEAEAEPKGEAEADPEGEVEAEADPEGEVEADPEAEEEEEAEEELEWVVVKKVNYLTDGDYLYNEDNLDKAIGYKTKKGNWKLYK